MKNESSAAVPPAYDARFTDVLATLNEAQRAAVMHSDGPALVLAGPGTGKTQVLSAHIGYLLSNRNLQVEPYNILCLTFTDSGAIAMRERLLEFIGPTAHRVNIYTFHAFCNDIIQRNYDYFEARDFSPISRLEHVELLQRVMDDMDKGNPLKRFKGDIYSDLPRIADLFQVMKREDWTPQLIGERAAAYLGDLPNREDYIYKKGNTKQGTKKGDVKTKQIAAEKERMDKLVAAAGLFPAYQELMFSEKRYDYDDMILWVARAFRSDEVFLQRHQELFQYFLVDEYQDTSGAQNEILARLTGYWDRPEVFAVGDDDQSIYRFQGASVKNILDYHSRYRDSVEVVVLTGNYRSTQPILNAAGHLIGKNRGRLIHEIPGISKDLEAVQRGQDADALPPALIELPNAAQEEAFIVRGIQRLVSEGVAPEDIAVIYSQHKVVDNIIRLLDQIGIAYSTARKTDLLTVPLISRFLNIIQYLGEEFSRPHSAEHLLYELLYYDFFGTSPSDIVRLSLLMRRKGTPHRTWRSLIADHLLLASEGLEKAEAIIGLDRNISRWLGMVPNNPLQQLAEDVLSSGGLLDAAIRSPDKVWLTEALTTFFGFIRDENHKNPMIKPADLLELTGRMRENRIALEIENTIHNRKGVNLITAHSSKGLEFRHVYVARCTKDLWEPSAAATSYRFRFPDTLTSAREDSDVEEKRRLFYVAMTRAKERLTLTWPLQVNNRQTERCRFIDDLLDGSTLATRKESLAPDELTGYSLMIIAPQKLRVAGDAEKEHLAELLRNYRLNTTHLNSYLKCPVSFYFEHLLRVPSPKNEYIAFGTVVHNALRRLFELMKDDAGKRFPPRQALLDLYAEEMTKERDAFADTQFGNRMHYGREVLAGYYDRYVNAWNKVVVTEYRIQHVEVDGVPISGVLDKIEFDGSRVNVVDYKTGRVANGKKKLKPPGDDDPSGGDYWRQLVFYKLLLDNDRRNKWVMESGEIDFIEKDEYRNEYVKTRLAITPDDIKAVRGQITGTYARIMNQEFGEGCGDEECRWCNFRAGQPG